MPRCNCSSNFIPFDRTWLCDQVATCKAVTDLQTQLAAAPKVAAGYATINLDNASNGTITVTFPAGFFAWQPRVVATFYGGSIFIACAAQTSVTSTILSLRHYKDTAQTGAFIVNWVAVQS